MEGKSLQTAIEYLVKNDIDTLISGKWDSHLTWLKDNGQYTPNYTKRVNRQELPEIYKETGGFVISKQEFIQKDSRFGKTIEIFPLEKREAIDIDDYDDWNICEFYLRRKRLLFVVSGNKEIGLGHVYNTLSIANEILNHEVVFLVDANSRMALDKIKSYNYRVQMQSEGQDLIEAISALDPDVIVNDRLDHLRRIHESFAPNRDEACQF